MLWCSTTPVSVSPPFSAAQKSNCMEWVEALKCFRTEDAARTLVFPSSAVVLSLSNAKNQQCKSSAIWPLQAWASGLTHLLPITYLFLNTYCHLNTYLFFAVKLVNQRCHSIKVFFFGHQNWKSFQFRWNWKDLLRQITGSFLPEEISMDLGKCSKKLFLDDFVFL